MRGKKSEKKFQIKRQLTTIIILCFGVPPWGEHPIRIIKELKIVSRSEQYLIQAEIIVVDVSKKKSIIYSLYI